MAFFLVGGHTPVGEKIRTAENARFLNEGRVASGRM
jgi:hypothetical protein